MIRHFMWLIYLSKFVGCLDRQEDYSGRKQRKEQTYSILLMLLITFVFGSFVFKLCIPSHIYIVISGIKTKQAQLYLPFCVSFCCCCLPFYLLLLCTV